jgi:phospholipase/carboxylesterase
MQMTTFANLQAPIEICSSTKPTASVIWLHGLGADGNDFVPVVEALNMADVRFILPHAPVQKVTLNNSYEMPAWYDIYGLSAGSHEDESGIKQAQTYIESLIAQEIKRGIHVNRIAIAGFSQGGAIALYTALRCEQALAGVLALSTYLPLKPSLAIEKTSANARIPIFMAHGRFDEVINLSTCKISVEALQAQGYDVNLLEYAMAHSVCIEEIDDIRAFLTAIFN